MRAYLKVVLGLISLLVVSAPATAGTFTLDITSSASQPSRYDHGVASTDSIQRATIVRLVTTTGQEKKSVSFGVEVANIGDRSFNFGPENVTVRPLGMKPIALTTYEEAITAERKKQGREKFWAGVGELGRAMSAEDAGATKVHGSYSGTTSGFAGGNYVSAQTHGTFSGTYYDSAAAAAAEREMRETNAAVRANLEARWAARSSFIVNLLRTTTVDPGVMYGGVATFPISKDVKQAKGPVQVTIEVNLVGETHIFHGQLSD